MSTIPRVSVIVPAFEAAEYIGETLASARSQTVEDIEIIVVDDGSTDETATIVERVASGDSRVRLIRQSNGGVAHARNTAIAAARGPYVAPLDADDIWAPAKLELQLEAMEREPGVVLAYCWYVSIDRDGRVAGPLDFRPRAEGDALIEFALQNVAGASSPLLLRSEVEAVGGYDPSLRTRGGQGSEDWKLFTLMAQRGPVALVPRFLMGYRRVPGSMSREHQPAVASHLAAIADVRSSVPELPPEVLAWSQIIHGTFMTGTYLREKVWRTAIRTAAWVAGRSIGHDPLFFFRQRTRAYLSMRRARRRERVELSQLGLHGQPFLGTDFSTAEQRPQPHLDRAREVFIQSFRHRPG